MDELVAVVIGIFIANYKAHEHPFLTCCVKAFIIALLCFFWLTGKDFINGVLTVERLKFGFILAVGLGVGLFIFFILVDFIFKDQK